MTRWFLTSTGGTPVAPLPYSIEFRISSYFSLFPRYPHQESSRKSQIFHHIYCPNIQTLLFDSEFFGHKKGSFTGANDDKIGALEFADKGTLFLDEIGDLILEFQSKFLFILENDYIRRLGENVSRKISVRFICATNKNLKKAMEAGMLRKDLFYRMFHYVLDIPPLRENKENIIEISQFYWYQMIQGSKIEKLNNEELDILCQCPFPGNIRELDIILHNVWFKFSHNLNLNRIDILIKEINKISLSEIKYDQLNHEAELYYKMTKEGKSFWDTVHKEYLDHRINRDQLKKIILMGLKDVGFDSKKLCLHFHIALNEYKNFLDFINKQRIKFSELRHEYFKKSKT